MMEDTKIEDERVGENALPIAEADGLRCHGGPPLATWEPQNELKEQVKSLVDERSRARDGLRSDDNGIHMGVAAPKPSNSSGDATMNLANNFSRADKEVCFDQPFLIYGAKKYKSAITKNPKDHDEVYSWGLALQESAASCGPDSGSSKDVLLEEACKRYEEATQLYAAHYNAHIQWADALFERAKLRSRTKEAEELWKQAANKYEEAVQLNWNSPQALNNWGLALQELSAIAPLREKEAIARIAIRKYRAAIRLEFDFCGAIYNLGTILYDFAEDAWRCAKLFNVKQVSHDDLYSQAALFIAAAHALKPNNSVYLSALRLVHSTLPLPYFKVGYLTTPPANNPLAPHQDWDRSLYVLNHERLQQGDETDEHLWGSSSGKSKGSAQIDISRIKIDVPDIVSVSACADVTLPQGAGLCVTTIHHPIFLVADTWESLEVWLDALRLVCTISARGKSDVLASVITG